MKYSLASIIPHTRFPFNLILHKRIHVKIGAISLGEIFFLLSWIAANIAIFVVQFNKIKMENPADIHRHWLHPLGHMQMNNLSLMFFLVTRYSLLEWIFGMPLERAVFYHRWISRWMVFSFIVHGTLGWIRFPGGAIITYEPDLWGFRSAAIMFSLFIFTFRPIRRKFWEFFWWTHQGLAVIGAVFSAIHAIKLIPAENKRELGSPYLLLIMIAFYVLDRIIRFINTYLFFTKVVSAKPEQIEVTRIELKKSCCRFPYESGQYVFINFPQVTPFEWHPFSISSAPHEENFTLHIKESGWYTRRLRNLAKDGRIALAFVDGPYGNLSVNIEQYNTLFLVAGGIGITPMMSILKDEVNKGKKTKIFFVWSVRDPLAFEWFGEFLRNLKSDVVELKLFATRGGKEASESPIKYTSKRPNMSEIFDEVVSKSSGNVAVLACGPAVVVDEVSKLSIAKSGKVNFHFHKETFAF